MTDKILALVSLLTLLGFLGIIIGFVSELDLIIVTVIVLVMAAYDFFTTLFGNKGDGSA